MLLLAQPGLNYFPSKGNTLFSVNEVEQFQCVLNDWLKVKLVVVAVNMSVKTEKQKRTINILRCLPRTVFLSGGFLWLLCRTQPEVGS